MSSNEVAVVADSKPSSTSTSPSSQISMEIITREEALLQDVLTGDGLSSEALSSKKHGDENDGKNDISDSDISTTSSGHHENSDPSDSDSDVSSEADDSDSNDSSADEAFWRNYSETNERVRLVPRGMTVQDDKLVIKNDASSSSESDSSDSDESSTGDVDGERSRRNLIRRRRRARRLIHAQEMREPTMTNSEKELRAKYGFHYDYVEAIAKLMIWFFVVLAFFQFSGRHEIIYQFAKPLIFVTVVPVSVLVIMYWREINQNHEDMMAKASMARMLREEREKGFVVTRKKKRKQDYCERKKWVVSIQKRIIN